MEIRIKEKDKTNFLSLTDGIADKLLIIGKLALNLLCLIFEPKLNHLSFMNIRITYYSVNNLSCFYVAV